MNKTKNDKIQAISTIMYENDISVDDIYRAIKEDNKQPLNILAGIGLTMILVTCFFLPQHIKFGDFRYFIPISLSLIFTYGLLFLYEKPSFSRYAQAANIIAFILFVFGINVIFNEYSKETNPLYLGRIISIFLLFQQYFLYKLKKTESGVWIMLFISGIITLDLLELTLQVHAALTVSLASLMTLALTYLFARNNYIRTLPLLYCISTGTFFITNTVYFIELKIAPELYLITPCILLVISKLLKSRAILCISLIALYSSLFAIFSQKLKETTTILIVTGSCLIIGVFLFIFGLKTKVKDVQ